jgi:AcrR family transcriptional regulator
MSKTSAVASSSSIETKERVLNAALKLFNEMGSASVTTHDVAEAAGISPGNLYYHFKNKQAIVRSLFYRIEIFSAQEWWSKSPAHREVRFTDFIRFYFESISKNQFFFKDFSYLLALDPVLAKEWSRAYTELFSTMREALSGWIKQGLIKPFATEREAELFIETIWTLTAFSQVHLQARSTSKRAQTQSSEEMMIRFMYPYHTAKGQRALDLYLQ